MTMPPGKRLQSGRLGAVLVLALAAVLLHYLDGRTQMSAPHEAAPVLQTENPGVEAAVDTMFNRYGIPRSSVRTWNVLSIGKKPIRVVQQIEVPQGFPSLVFNDRLQRLLEPIGAHVFATERSRDNIVTMHIVCRGQTIRSMAFSLTQAEE